VDTKGSQGLKTISRDLGRISKDVSTTSRAVSGLRTAFNALAGISIAGFGIKGLVKTSDEIQLLRDRISVFEGSTEAANATLAKLVDVSARTASPLATTAIAYNRLALALDDVGVRGNALLGVVETLQNSFRLAGATIAEVRGATIQLSQGLASGELRGQELRSVLEANAIFGEILSKQTGIERGNLIRSSERRGGFSTSEVLQALAGLADELERRAANLSLTIEQSLALAFNKVQLGILRVNDQFKLTEKFSIALNFAVVNLADGLVLVGAALATLALPTVISGLSSLLSLIGAITASSINFSIAVAAITGKLTPLLVLGGKLVLIFAGFALLFKAATDFEGFKIIVEKGLLTILDKFLAAEKAAANFIGRFRKSSEAQAKLAEANAKVDAEREGIAKRLLILDSEKLKLESEKVAQAQAGKDALKALAEEERRKELLDGKQIKNLTQLNFAYSEGIIGIEKYRKELLRLKTEDIANLFETGKIDIDERDKRLKALTETTTKASQKFKLLNDEFARTGNLTAYSQGLRKLELDSINKQFDEGSTNLESYQQSLDKLKLQDLTRELNSGVISLKQFNEESRFLRVDELNRKFAEGTIGLVEYNSELDKISQKFSPGSALLVGTANYIESTGTLATNLAGAISNTFTRLEDSLTEFVKTGRFEFAKFTQAILDDLTKIIIRASIVQPLAQGLLNFAAPGAGSFGGGATLGGGVGGGTSLTAFASGGVVDSPTFFNYGGNRSGVAGEAGPEAIIPLKRTSSGELGVQGTPPVVNVNIINNAGAEVETRETTNENGERSIEVLIVGTVKNALSKGSFDRQFGTQYGLRRRGA